MEIWEKYVQDKIKKEQLASLKRQEEALQREKEALETKCDNCKESPAYPFEVYDMYGYWTCKMQGFKANLCKNCQSKLEKLHHHPPRNSYGD